jgi:predicted transcriptional regulator
MSRKKKQPLPIPVVEATPEPAPISKAIAGLTCDSKTLLKTLKGIREYRGYTQRQVADKIGCTQNILSLYESGYTAIPFSRLIKLTEFYGFNFSVKLVPKN